MNDIQQRFDLSFAILWVCYYDRPIVFIKYGNQTKINHYSNIMVSTSKIWLH